MSKKLLIVDDDPVIRMLVSDIASSFGHTVETFEKGEDCISSLSTALPDLIILDLQMPGMNGIDVLRKLRADKRTAEVPVIMLSANSDSQTLSTENPRADCYLQKPFNVGDLLSALNETKR